MAHPQPAVTGRPLQRIPWSEKIAKEKQWFKDTARYYIRNSSFASDNTNSKKDLELLYQVYNNQFPAKWFSHVTDPLNAKDERNKKFPAKIRPISILRTNIDLLLGEYPRRPFVYQVNNLGEGGYNSYMESLQAKVTENLTQHFVANVQQEAAAQGVPVNEIPGLEEIELPEALKERFTSTYKDAIAVKGQRWMRRAIREYGIKNKLIKMFKDWLIAGQVRSYKGIERGNLVYEHVSPINLDHDKSPDLEHIEDGEWAVRRRLRTNSDLVDSYYDDLSNEEFNKLERYKSPSAFFSHLSSLKADKDSGGKHWEYHVTWKGKKAVKILTYPDPLSGEPQQMEVDEDYPVNKEIGETAETIYVNEVYETTCIGNDIFVRMQPIPAQRNAMNNISTCKLPYNGRNFSDTHADNISVLEIGLHFQIMHMIVNRTLEMTIAKSKGKILLIDKNAIPRGDGWTDEKFFYYAEALGYGLMNRNQQGVDKTWNQYQVLDMTLFESIKQLIELQGHFKQEWDDAIGINRIRKGATFASDGKGVSEMNMMQSSVITDTIFNNFEQFTESELQGILDLSKFVNIDGVKSIYNNDDFDTELLDIDPDTYSYAELGILMTSSVDETNALNQLKNVVQPMIQAGAKPSTIGEIFRTQNVAELTMKLKRIEELQAQVDNQIAESEEQRAQMADDRARMFAEFQNDLEAVLLEKEWDRKDQNTMIKGEYDMVSFGGDGDVNDNGVPDAVEIEKRVIERQKIFTDAEVARDAQRSKERIHARQDATKNREILSKERIAAGKKEVDLKKAQAQRSKPKK